MSYSYQEGKDIVHFITEEDLHEYTEQSDRGEKDPRGEKEQISVTEEAHDQYPGAVNEKGEINWDCPCLGERFIGICLSVNTKLFVCIQTHIL